MPFVFGYGSLMNQPSAEKTLSRSFGPGDFQCVTLRNYVRSWTAPGCIRLMQNGKTRLCDALFLDLSHCPGQSCNGVVIEVNERELQILDIRENGYERCVVELECDNGDCLEGFTYMIPECSKQHEGVIPARYRKMVTDALQAHPPAFATRFWETTRVSEAPVVEGKYVFENCAQNKVAGRTLSAPNKNPSLLPALVDVDWLIANQHRDDIVILDASWHMPGENRDGEAEWQQVRIPGSRYFDFDGRIARTDTDLPHMMPSAAVFNSEVLKLGVNQNSYIVVYDAMGVFTSPRAWWMFRAMGHDNVAVLNGGLPAWQQAGQPVESGDAKAVAEGDFSAIERVLSFRNVADVQAALEDVDTLVLDARSAERFNAEVDEPRAGLRRGHMPGALNLPFTDLLRDTVFLADPAVLRQAFEQLGIVDTEQRMIFSCGSGVTACVLALAAELAGFNDLSVYDGSWAEWGRLDNDLPVEPCSLSPNKT